MIDLSIAFRHVVEAIESAGIEYVVVGSTAAASWGVVRATRDIDLVTVIEAGGDDLLATLLARDDLYVPAEDAREAIASGGTFNVLHPTSGGKVDIFVRSAQDAFTRSRLARRIPVDLFGVSTWVATAEDVVLAKLRWRVESRSEIQWRDCVEIAATQPLDRAYLSEWANGLGVADDLEELLDDVTGA